MNITWVITLRLNKNVLIAILLLSVFAVGTLSFTDTVEAATWKKIDSGTIYGKTDPGYKNKLTYVSYIKGSKDIKMNFYGYKTKNNKKVLGGIIYFSKVGNKIKITEIDSKGEKSKPEYISYGGTVKQYYKSFKSTL